MPEMRALEQVRLFPLPNVLLFPGALVPLHVFEPRYRALVGEALSSDKQVALVLLKPGWKADYEGSPAIHSVACLGRIVDSFRLPDGRYNIAVVGLARIRIVEEVTGRPFRQALVERIEDRASAGPGREALAEFLDLAHLVYLRASGILQPLDFGPTDLARPGRLADRVAAALRVQDETKQAILEELDLASRVTRLSRELARIVEEHLVPKSGPFRAPFRFDRN